MAFYLVTGGAGFIGSHIALALVKRGDRVRILDNLSTGRRDNMKSFAQDIEFLQGDVADADAVKKAVAGVDCVFHQAALASVPMSIEKPLNTHAACATGTITVLDQAYRAGVQRVVYAASSSLYGDLPGTAKRETDPANPLSPYAAAKLSGEMYCQSFYHSFDLETVCLRYFNVFGPRQDPDSPYSAVIPLFITAMLAGRQPVVYGNGLQSRDFTFVGNVVHGNLLAAAAKNVGGQSFNMADGRSITLLQLIDALNEMLGTEIKPRFDKPRVGDVLQSMADITRARQQLGYEPQVDFFDGLRQSIDYYRTLCDSTDSGRSGGEGG